MGLLNRIQNVCISFNNFNYILWYTLSLTRTMWGLSYLSLTRRISCLLMPWLLALPGHQQPWYWLCKISKSWSYTGKDFNYLWHVSVEEWHKMWIHVYVSFQQFSMLRVKWWCCFWYVLFEMQHLLQSMDKNLSEILFKLISLRTILIIL